MEDRVIDKVYSKEDIRLELKLTTHAFNKRMNTIAKLFKINMKKFTILKENRRIINILLTESARNY